MMVRIIIMITSTTLIATRIKNARGLYDGPEAPPPGCVGEAVALCCVEAVFDPGDALVEVDIGELEEGSKLDPVSCVGVRARVVDGSRHTLLSPCVHNKDISRVFWAARQKADEKSNCVEGRRGVQEVIREAMGNQSR